MTPEDLNEILHSYLTRYSRLLRPDQVGELLAELKRENKALFLRLYCVGYHDPPVHGAVIVHYPEGFDGLPGEFWCAFCGVEHPIPEDVPADRVIWRLMP